MRKLFGFRNEVLDGSVCDQEKQKQGYFATTKKRLKFNIVITGRNGGSKILPQLYGVATACCISLQISKLQI